MSKFYEIIPLDTLFFRGSTPMEAGLMNAVSLFPPSESVIKGAFWTTYCKNNNKSFSEGLIKTKNSEGCIEEKIPFEVEGFFIKKSGVYYMPCPATWYYDSEKKVSSGKNLKGISLIEAKDVSAVMQKLGMKSSAGNIVFVNPKQDAKSLLGAWVSVNFFKKPKDTFGDTDILFASDIFSIENRTGVALDTNKKAKEGQLYSSSHIRLDEKVTLIIQLGDEIGLEGNGTIFLGGEKRISQYSLLKEGLFIETEGGENAEFVSLMPIEATEDSLKALVSSGKIITTAGWDLQQGFHKSTTNWIPAGAVFNKKINNSCVAIIQNK